MSVRFSKQAIAGKTSYGLSVCIDAAKLLIKVIIITMEE